MKERITYLLGADGEAGVNPARVNVTEDMIEVPPELIMAKEWKFTFGLEVLPVELQQLLKDSHEMHIRWASATYHDTVTPLNARMPSGLHVFYTPLKDRPIPSDLCLRIKEVFGQYLKCDDAQEAFTQPGVLSERFASSSAYQYHQLLPQPDYFQVWVAAQFCARLATLCYETITSLSQANLLEFDYDAISQSAVVKGSWPAKNETEFERRHQRPEGVSLEVGILNREKAADEEQISLGGFLMVLGEDDKPKPTLFSFPSRHHRATNDKLAFHASFVEPAGLHPTLQLSFPRQALSPPAESCALHAYLTLPSTLFIDRYQLSDKLFLQSQNLKSLRSLSGETDLEAPEWVIKRWGSAALLELATPDNPETSSPSTSSAESWNVKIPMHLRYLPPRQVNESHIYPEPLVPALEDMASESDFDGKRLTSIPYPTVFWACRAESGTKMNVNPFDSVNLGYDGLFGPKTMFYHVPPQKPANVSAPLLASLQVPVLDGKQTAWVEAGTAAAVLLGFGWVCWQLGSGWWKGSKKEADEAGPGKAKQKKPGSKKPEGGKKQK